MLAMRMAGDRRSSSLAFRILRNAASILLSNAAGEVFTSYSLVLTALSLGAAKFGTLSASQAFVDMFQTVTTFGLTAVTTTIAARFGGPNGALLGTLRRVQLGLSLLTIFLTVLVAKITGREVELPVILLALVNPVTTAFSFAAQLPFRFEQRMHRIVHVPSVAGVVRLGLTYSAVRLLNVPAAHQAAIAAAAVVSAILIHRASRRDYPEVWRYDSMTARRLLVTAWPAALQEAVVVFYTRAGYILLRSAGPEAQGEYAAADRLARPVLSIAGALVASSLPSIASLAATSDSATVLRAYRRVIVRTLQILGPLAILVSIAAGELLQRFVPTYGGSSQPFAILSVAVVFMFLNQISTMFIDALGHFRTSLVVALSNLIVYVSCAAVMIPRYQATGAASATLTMEALNCVAQYFLLSHLIKKHTPPAGHIGSVDHGGGQVPSRDAP